MEAHSRPTTQQALPRRHPRLPVFLMHITVDKACLAQLRQLVVQTCGTMLSFMRIEAVDHAERMKVWLCVTEPALRMTMDAVMRLLPAAEFGRISQGKSA
ncbi:hypothetical protein [Janthinobacterium sp. RT4P48]|uniref:hypothetical protein n=1 Tax=Janthinobacterium sp. RT4P48 TaxID=3424188 RepID=UPI003F21787D